MNDEALAQHSPSPTHGASLQELLILAEMLLSHLPHLAAQPLLQKEPFARSTHQEICRLTPSSLQEFTFPVDPPSVSAWWERGVAFKATHGAQGLWGLRPQGGFLVQVMKGKLRDPQLHRPFQDP